MLGIFNTNWLGVVLLGENTTCTTHASTNVDDDWTRLVLVHELINPFRASEVDVINGLVILVRQRFFSLTTLLACNHALTELGPISIEGVGVFVGGGCLLCHF